ncbi:hypothetical protein [Methanobrevibacter arboriphilus]|uniref:Uncharacterized protein n=1 Tax=Methanobrevibacter arboriphilus TaxID=39441 RepID=A0ACA8R1S7_METAZ|nr:hypothetical protein [Methanobrevibacter arboriphilus]BBL61505.1 hypothetical protein MarbSA_05450 [Methanobrevibacter arboriphilus]
MSGVIDLKNGVLKVWLKENARPVEFNFLTSFSPEKADDTSTKLTSDGEVQIGAPNTGAEVSVEGVAYGKNKQQIKEQLRVFAVGNFYSALWSGEENTNDSIDSTPYVHEFLMFGGTIKRTSEWSPEDQFSNKMTIKTNKLTELVDGYDGSTPLEGVG